MTVITHDYHMHNVISSSLHRVPAGWDSGSGYPPGTYNLLDLMYRNCLYRLTIFKLSLSGSILKEYARYKGRYKECYIWVLNYQVFYEKKIVLHIYAFIIFTFTSYENYIYKQSNVRLNLILNIDEYEINYIVFFQTTSNCS